MTMQEDFPIDLSDHRFARLEAIEWWDQELLASSKILVAGAGALGNEVIKNLALLGIGNLIIADMDRIELSNLSRSVLYRAHDEGKLKAEQAVAAACEIYPDLTATPYVGNLLADVGLGAFRWADVVIGALDNREARVFINSACAQVGTPWIDGGIEVLHGIVRAFNPPHHACYECTMSRTDWDLLNKRRSCSLLARRAIQQRGTPTTPTTASVIGGIQAQEAVKFLHGRNDFQGRGFFFDGATHESYPITYGINEECDWHDDPIPVRSDLGLASTSSFAQICEVAAGILGGVTEIEFSREIVRSLDCPTCGGNLEQFRPLQSVSEADAWCKTCNVERSPAPLHCVRPADDELLAMSPRSVGLPEWDILWARHGTEYVGLELDGADVLLQRRNGEMR